MAIISIDKIYKRLDKTYECTFITGEKILTKIRDNGLILDIDQVHFVPVTPLDKDVVYKYNKKSDETDYDIKYNTAHIIKFKLIEADIYELFVKYTYEDCGFFGVKLVSETMKIPGKFCRANDIYYDIDDKKVKSKDVSMIALLEEYIVNNNNHA